MKVAFYAPDGAGDKLLVAAVMAGAKRHVDEVVYVPTYRYDGVIAGVDAAACYGVRASSRIILEAYRRAGKRTLFFDKGYWGRGVYTRVAIDAWQPTAYFQRGLSDERLRASNLEVPPREAPRDGIVLYCATTQTWHDFYDLGPARAWDEMIVRLLAETHGAEKVVYRPRPAYAVKHPELCGPIDGVSISSGCPLADELPRCYRVVTIGSNAAIEAAAAGVPVKVLGDNPCRLLNGVREFALKNRRQFFADLAWWQWTLEEYLSGEAWKFLKSVMSAE